MLPSIFGENLFDDFFTDGFMPIPVWNGRSPLYGKHAKNLMKTDVRETDGYLTVSAAKGLDKDEKDKQGKYIRQERYAGACSRSFYVGEAVQPGEVHAKYEDGILRIDVPKKETQAVESPSRIAIG